MTSAASTFEIPAGIVGAVAGPVASTVDARWLMAYAAGIGEEDPIYYDTASPGGPVAHPLFPVAYEWPAALALRQQTVGEALHGLGVHATHRLVIHRPPRVGDALLTTARVIAVRQRRSGALVVARHETVDAGGQPVTTTTYGTVYRGARVGEDAGDLEQPPAPEAGEVRWDDAVPVPGGAGHVYTECARIWNPIHTDVAVARARGLPAPILHGTATLALAVSRVIAHELGGDPARVREVAARFTGMVVPPTVLVVRGRGRRRDLIVFEAVDAEGRPVLGEGALWYRLR